MTVILCENVFEESIWCQKIYDGLKNELKKGRITYVKASDPDSLASGDTVYIIGSSFAWINHSVSRANALNITPIILCNQAANMLQGKFHSISTDTDACMKQLIASANTSSTSRIALYGVNNNSISDKGRAKSFIEQTSNTEGVFFNNGSLENCFHTILPRLSEFDAIICVNNFAAISFVQNLSKRNPRALERLTIISCSSGKLSSIFSKFIIFVDPNFEHYGKAALEIAKFSEKAPYISGIHVTIEWDLDRSSLPKAQVEPSDLVQMDNFYEDTEIRKLLTVEKLLNFCDNTDILILRMMMRGDSYDTIADQCFLATDSVKYRIKKYFKICKVNTKADFIALMNEIDLSHIFTEFLF